MKDSYTEAEEAWAKKLFASFKEAQEEQGTPYAFWDTLSKRHKLAWLHTASQFLTSIVGQPAMRPDPHCTACNGSGMIDTGDAMPAFTAVDMVPCQCVGTSYGNIRGEACIPSL